MTELSLLLQVTKQMRDVSIISVAETIKSSGGLSCLTITLIFIPVDLEL